MSEHAALKALIEEAFAGRAELSPRNLPPQLAQALEECL